MGMIEVVHFRCDDASCKDLPCMTYDEAIDHTEHHVAEQLHEYVTSLTKGTKHF